MWGVELAHSLGTASVYSFLVSFRGKGLLGSLYVCLCLGLGLALLSAIKSDTALCNEQIKSLLAEGVSSS